MHLSVIIPTLNEADQIGSLVRHLRTHGDDSLQEIIVVDAGSSDSTVAAAKMAGALTMTSPIKSRAAQMNAGARAAKGDVLYFVHADTLPPASFATDIRQAVETSGYVMGCYRYRFNSDSIWLKINAYFNRFPWLWCQGGDKTFFIKKNIFMEMDGYDERFTIMEEYDFLRRALRRYRLLTIPKYALVSARKYARNSWLRVQLANMVVFNLFRLGVKPNRLKRMYGTLLK